MKVSNWLAAGAAAHPRRPALICGDRKLSYAELDRQAGEAARRLNGAGVKPSDRVATTLSAGVELVVLTHAAMRLGAVIAPIDPGLSTTERNSLLGSLDPALTVDRPGWIEEAPLGQEPIVEGELDLEQALCLIHTSGTSGTPKRVELSCGNHLWSAVGCGMRIGMTPDDHWLCCLPMHHIGGFAIPIRAAIYGATVVIEPFDAAATSATVAGGEVTIVSLVATMLDRLLDLGGDAGALRCALLGGGPAPASLIERAVEAGFPVAPTYGMTETCSQVTTLPPEELRDRPGSSGKPLASTKLRIDDDGRILVSGPTVATGQAGDGGWLRTGDLGRIDEAGYLYVLGRADDVILTGGENVSPEEVERVVAGHPDVVDVAAIARDDERWQQAVVALVVTREDKLDVDDLRAYCRERLAGYKVPKSFEAVAELPRNAQGKLLRAQLR